MFVDYLGFMMAGRPSRDVASTSKQGRKSRQVQELEQNLTEIRALAIRILWLVTVLMLDDMNKRKK